MSVRPIGEIEPLLAVFDLTRNEREVDVLSCGVERLLCGFDLEFPSLLFTEVDLFETVGMIWLRLWAVEWDRLDPINFYLRILDS